MGLEKHLNHRVCKALAGYHPVRIENCASSGTPDINFLHGWIEDKTVEFPKRMTSVVRVDHYTPRQRSWHAARRAVGGKVWVALENKATGELYMIDAIDAARYLSMVWTEEDLQAQMRRGGLNFFLPYWNERDFRRLLDNALRS